MRADGQEELELGLAVLPALAHTGLSSREPAVRLPNGKLDVRSVLVFTLL